MPVKGFRQLDLPLGSGLASHCLLLKEHVEKGMAGAVTEPTLFVGNAEVSNYFMTDNEIGNMLIDIFSFFGEVTSVSVSKYAPGQPMQVLLPEALESESDGAPVVTSLTMNNVNSFPAEAINKTAGKPMYSGKSDIKTKFAHVCFAKRSSLQSCLTASAAVYREIGAKFLDQFGQGGSSESTKVNIGDYSFMAKDSNNSILNHLRSQSTINYKSQSQSQLHELKTSLFESLKEFEDIENEKLKELQALSREVDDDGFQTVVYNKKRVRSDPSEEGALAAGDGDRDRRAKKKLKKSKELKNFYRHQIREEKREQLVTLRKQFDEDRERIRAMKQSRKFKPF